MNESVSDFQRTSVTIGDATFMFEKLLPMEAFRAFEGIRPGLASAFDSAPAQETDEAFLKQVLKALLATPVETVDFAMAALFRSVKFTNAATKTPTRVSGMEDTAFMGLEPIHIYEVLGRAFAVNFTGSLDAIKSRIPAQYLSTLPNTSTSQDS